MRICRQCKLPIHDKGRFVFCSPKCTAKWNRKFYGKNKTRPKRPIDGLALWRYKKWLVARRKKSLI